MPAGILHLRRERMHFVPPRAAPIQEVLGMASWMHVKGSQGEQSMHAIPQVAARGQKQGQRALA